MYGMIVVIMQMELHGMEMILVPGKEIPVTVWCFK